LINQKTIESVVHNLFKKGDICRASRRQVGGPFVGKKSFEKKSSKTAKTQKIKLFRARMFIRKGGKKKLFAA
jgi:hypothetical protein